MVCVPNKIASANSDDLAFVPSSIPTTCRIAGPTFPCSIQGEIQEFLLGIGDLSGTIFGIFSPSRIGKFDQGFLCTGVDSGEIASWVGFSEDPLEFFGFLSSA